MLKVFQVEYYFSDENLPTDKFMLKHVKKDKQGFGKYHLTPMLVLVICFFIESYF